ncbi:MAG: S-layer homology domain-containing protein [Oscillospiraceae bacterium]|nr:S-layer homology domain-containing protein [Oscillospiraceae bacterium]
MRKKAGKLLSVVLVLAMVAGLLSTAVFAAPITFTDVKEGSWYYNDVQKAVDTGLINGYPDNTFGPDKNMTYAEAIKLAAVMHKLAASGSAEFETGSPWYKPYADYAKEAGIISKDYDWNKNATRAGYMEIFANAIPEKPTNSDIKALEKINNIPDNSIPDVSMSHPQAASIYKLYRAGVLQGNNATEHLCNPDANIKRSEVAAVLTRMMNASARISFSMSETDKLIGRVEDGKRYVNDALKLSFNKPDSWIILSDKEVLELFGVVTDIITDKSFAEEFEKKLEAGDVSCLFYAKSADSTANTNITVMRLSGLEVLIGEEEIALASKEDVIADFSNIGITNISGDVSTVKIGGQEHFALKIKGSLGDSTIYSHTIMIRSGVNLFILNITTLSQEAMDDIYASWQAVK